MMIRVRNSLMMIALLAVAIGGCAASNVSFSEIQRPDRAAELDAYDIFVGSWTWEAQMLNAAAGEESWTGTAQWMWTLDRRCLQGQMSSTSKNATFESSGIWSWHPKQKKYKWWMFNNWGYPQEGSAKYDDATKTWKMPYRSVGLDGTTSHGCYTMIVSDNDTLDWEMVEWADALHMVKKAEMKGTYRRRR